MYYSSYSEPNYALYIIIGVLMCVITALISAHIAKNKGKEPAMYAVLGFLLPIIGIIVVVLAEDESKNRRNSSLDRSNVRSFRMVTFPIKQWYLDLPFEVIRNEIRISPDKEKAFLILTMMNLNDKAIRSVYLKFRCFDDTGEEIGEREFSYAYQDLSAGERVVFGGNEPIELPDVRIRHIDILFEKMSFTDGCVLTKNDISEKETLIEKELINDADLKDSKFVESSIGKNFFRCECVPMVDNSEKWLCMCGRTNCKTEKCLKCGRTLQENKTVFSQENIDKWKKKKSDLKEKKELNDKKNKVRLIKIGIIAIAVIVVGIAISGIYKIFWGYSDIAGEYSFKDPGYIAKIMNERDPDGETEITNCVIKANGDITFYVYNDDIDIYEKKTGRLVKSDNSVHDYGIKVNSRDIDYYLDYEADNPLYDFDEENYCILDSESTEAYYYLVDGGWHCIDNPGIDPKSKSYVGKVSEVDLLCKCKYCDKFATLKLEYSDSYSEDECAYVCYECEKVVRDEITSKMETL